MQKLTSERNRLYLPDRALALPFDREGGSNDARHWARLCTVANALQDELGFPAPAVGIDGASGFRLWLSLETPVPKDQAEEFFRLLRLAYFPEVEADPQSLWNTALPPCLNPGTGKWAAFIHPGMGESFAEDHGLDMEPSPAGQLGFLEGLSSVSEEQFLRGLELLRQKCGTSPVASGPAAGADRLLLKDATLEDIVRFLHSKNIEPTFRHLLPGSR